MEAILEANLESFCVDASTPEESNVMLQLFGTSSFMPETNQVLNLETPSMYWPDHDAIPSSCYSSSSSSSYSDINASFCYLGQGSCGNGGYYYLTCPNCAAASENNCNSSFTPLELLLDEPACFAEETSNDGSTESNLNLLEMFSLSGHDQRPFPLKGRVETVESSLSEEADEEKDKLQTSKNVQKKKRKTEPKRTQKKKKKKSSESEDDSKLIIKQHSSSSCSSEEDESCESKENNGDGRSSRSKGPKLRSERGAAIDPQSLYARKRRERINEKLRILQKMVPNGTKVDISTMLEEAVQYVKFLQVQIKLLSSDELWMYAPIAYNGINLGLDLKLAQQLL